MRIHTQSCPCTVAGKAGITLRVAGLAGGQILPGFPGMAARPLVRGQYRIGVAVFTGAVVEQAVGRT